MDARIETLSRVIGACLDSGPVPPEAIKKHVTATLGFLGDAEAVAFTTASSLVEMAVDDDRLLRAWREMGEDIALEYFDKYQGIAGKTDQKTGMLGALRLYLQEEIYRLCKEEERE